LSLHNLVVIGVVDLTVCVTDVPVGQITPLPKTPRGMQLRELDILIYVNNTPLVMPSPRCKSSPFNYLLDNYFLLFSMYYVVMCLNFAAQN